MHLSPQFSLYIALQAHLPCLESLVSAYIKGKQDLWLMILIVAHNIFGVQHEHCKGHTAIEKHDVRHMTEHKVQPTHSDL